MSKKKEAGKSKAEILIVEDSPTQVAKLKHLLKSAGYKVSTAVNGKEALTYLKDHKPTLVICDILMPEMDGYELCKRIKTIKDFKGIPVMLLTALSDPEDVVKGLECGADNFVTKPYTEKSILSQIQYIILNKELRVKRFYEKKNAEILVVEDSLTQAHQMKHLLEKHDYKVLVAGNGVEALSLLEKHTPSLLISDILMPEMNGFDLCSKIKADERLSKIPVVLLTALSEPEDLVRGLTSGADNFLTKPYSDEFLMSQIDFIRISKEIRSEHGAELGIEIFFGGKKHMITSNRMQIIDLLLSTYETAVEKKWEAKQLNVELNKAQDELKKLNEELEEKVKERIERIDHLNLVLRAIRNVNQLIAMESDRDRLLQGACKSLIETRSYHNAWIAVLDDARGLVTAAEAGLGKDFSTIIERLERGELPECGRRALKQSDVVAIEDTSTICEGCPLADKSLGRGALSVRLEHDGKVYGFITVSIPVHFIADEEEHALLREVAGDLAFALNSIESEEKRKQAVEVLRESEVRFRGIYESEMMGTLFWDANGDITDANDAFLQMVGYTRDEILSGAARWRDMTPPEYKEQDDKALEEVATKGAMTPIEKEYIRKDGSRVPIFLGAASLPGPALNGVAFVLDLTDRKRAEEERDKLLYDMSERIKELDCLYGVSKLVAETDKSLEEIFQETVNLIPPAWQYPEITCARIVFKDSMFKTKNFNKSKWKQSTDIIVSGENVGTIEVYYLVEMPEEHEGPFVKEERDLIDDLGRQLGAIAEHKQAEEALRESEEKYHQIVSTSTDAIMIFDAETKDFVEANKAAEDLYGYSREEFLNMNIQDISAEEKKTKDAFKSVLRGELDHVPVRYHKKLDGTVFPVEISASQFYVKDRTFVCGVVRDITDRKQAEEKLKEYSENLEEMVEERTEELKRKNKELGKEVEERKQIQDALSEERERLSVTLRSIGDGMIAADIEGKITILNKAAESLTGWTQKDALGKPLIDIFNIINQKTRVRCVNPVEMVLKTGEIVGLANDTVLVARDGTERIIADSGAPIHDKDGNVIGVVLVFSNITERKQAEEALRESDKNYQTLYNNSLVALFRVSLKDQKVLYANNLSTELFGYASTDEFIREFKSVKHYANLEDREPILRKLNEKGFIDKIIIPSKKKDGTLIWNESSFRVNTEEAYVDCMAIDITERKELQERLMHTEKLAILGQLAGGVGHELRNPLGAIKNAVYFLDMALEEPEPEVKETLEVLNQEVTTSERIISSLLGFARPKPPVKKKVNLNQIVQDALSRATVPENVEVKKQLDDALPDILADPDQLGQVFGNILLNGIQAMPEGGRLEIKSETTAPERVAVSISDTGEGISDKDLNKIFEPLFTTKAKGIGLGLALTRILVEANGGSISVESETGKGSTFRVKLPVSGSEEV